MFLALSTSSSLTLSLLLFPSQITLMSFQINIPQNFRSIFFLGRFVLYPFVVFINLYPLYLINKYFGHYGIHMRTVTSEYYILSINLTYMITNKYLWFVCETNATKSLYINNPTYGDHFFVTIDGDHFWCVIYIFFKIHLIYTNL